MGADLNMRLVGTHPAGGNHGGLGACGHVSSGTVPVAGVVGGLTPWVGLLLLLLLLGLSGWLQGLLTDAGRGLGGWVAGRGCRTGRVGFGFRQASFLSQWEGL